MSELEPHIKTFDVNVGGHELSLAPWNCAAYIFRSCVEVNYLWVGREESGHLKVFNNPKLVQYMAGYEIQHTPNGMIRRSVDSFGELNDPFRDLSGWNPTVVEKDKPTEAEMNDYIEVNAGTIDTEWRELE